MKDISLVYEKALGNISYFYFMTDPIADMIIRMKNAVMVNKPMVSLPYSKLKHVVAQKLHKKKIFSDVSVRGEGIHKRLDLSFHKTDANKYTFSGVSRISKPGCRVYSRSNDIRAVKGGRGFALISTPKGILFHYEAQKENVGGEILFEIW
jgi:small subunit ribosomal protein S8